MTAGDNTSPDHEQFEDPDYDLDDAIKAAQRLTHELACLFGEDTVELANQIDIADLNMNKDMIDCISMGVRQLKQAKNNLDAQRELISKMAPGERLVLCLWIMDMDLLDKIQSASWLQ